MLRTKTCGELRKEHIGQTITLAGWVDTVRDHSGVLFINLRDRYGLTQITFIDNDGTNSLADTVRSLHPEDVVQVTGKVQARPEGIVNKKIPTGEIEIAAETLTVLNRTEVVPFQPSAPEIPAEETRLKYRFLDLRRPAMQKTMVLRHRIVKELRDYFDELDFVEIETPILGKSTPEGARDYLVPSRIAKGEFYALPQSPQLYKQILMIAGYDRYIQIARCFRDEDLRADRQPEFTQLDLEMSFIDLEDILEVISGLVVRLMKNILGRDVKLPIQRISYDDAMERFGHDSPDLRFGMELVDLTEVAANCNFTIFKNAASNGGRVRAINAKGAAEKYSRKAIDELNQWSIEQFGAKGVAWLKVDNENKLAGPIAKNFTEQELTSIAEKLDAAAGDFLLFSADTFETTCKVLNGLRRRLAAELKLIDPKEMNFCWVLNFPMFDWDAEENHWFAMHHPFTAPLAEHLPLLNGSKEDIKKIRAQAYDLVLNGFEAGGGTIRIHNPEIQSKVFGLLGLSQETARQQFGFLLDALQFGAPPHGGIALGLDRLVMLFAGLDNIRDCIAFPKTAKAGDLMTGAPSPVAEKQLDELAITCKPEPQA
ncbi:MAG: aspartate--tRNA ligase [Planctomycetaceae bacterium]|nr:aspartate--tRNA ligase [Planctomycetaceae bacterium]